MSMRTFTESIVENAALAWLEGLGYSVLHLPAPPACAWHADRQSDETRQAGGPEIVAGESSTERRIGLSL
jgi:hypothetical protein